MINKKSNLLYDSWIMFKRSLLISVRNPEALVVTTLVPFFLMFTFAKVFGSVINIGNFNYIDFIIPGVILQSVSQAAQYSALNVTTDMTKGIIDRFRSMPISSYSVLIGHTGAGVVRNTITTSIIIGAAFIFGFKPLAGFTNWIIVISLLILINIVFSLIAVLAGLIAKTPEGANGLMFPLFILPFFSSGFAPAETMSDGIRWFASNQPMTPIIDTVRSLMLNMPTKDNLWIAFTWCIGIIVVVFFTTTKVYKHKFS